MLSLSEPFNGLSPLNIEYPYIHPQNQELDSSTSLEGSLCSFLLISPNICVMQPLIGFLSL
jgi:hypothetical protein